MFIAPRGQREVAGRHAPIGDPAVTALLTALSRQIWLRTTLWAALFTAIALAIPW